MSNIIKELTMTTNIETTRTGYFIPCYDYGSYLSCSSVKSEILITMCSDVIKYLNDRDGSLCFLFKIKKRNLRFLRDIYLYLYSYREELREKKLLHYTKIRELIESKEIDKAKDKFNQLIDQKGSIEIPADQDAEDYMLSDKISLTAKTTDDKDIFLLDYDISLGDRLSLIPYWYLNNYGKISLSIESDERGEKVLFSESDSIITSNNKIGLSAETSVNNRKTFGGFWGSKKEQNNLSPDIEVNEITVYPSKLLNKNNDPHSNLSPGTEDAKEITGLPDSNNPNIKLSLNKNNAPHNNLSSDTEGAKEITDLPDINNPNIKLSLNKYNSPHSNLSSNAEGAKEINVLPNHKPYVNKLNIELLSFNIKDKKLTDEDYKKTVEQISLLTERLKKYGFNRLEFNAAEEPALLVVQANSGNFSEIRYSDKSLFDFKYRKLVHNIPENTEIFGLLKWVFNILTSHNVFKLKAEINQCKIKNFFKKFY